MLCESFPCYVSHFRLCQLFHVVPVILFFVSHFIYFVSAILCVPDILGSVSHFIYFASTIVCLPPILCSVKSFYCVALFLKLSDPDHISHFLYAVMLSNY
jgi:hypothetical protein